jgi:hypothetical protein
MVNCQAPRCIRQSCNSGVMICTYTLGGYQRQAADERPRGMRCDTARVRAGCCRRPRVMELTTQWRQVGSNRLVSDRGATYLRGLLELRPGSRL